MKTHQIEFSLTVETNYLNQKEYLYIQQPFYKKIIEENQKKYRSKI